MVDGLQIGALIVVVVVVVGVLAAVFARRRFVRAPFRLLLPLLYRKQVVGLENLPRDGGCIVVCNHISWIDGILLLWMLPRNIRFVVDGANFKSPFARFLSDAFGTILMNSGPKAIGRALREASTGARQGDVIGLFPEGTISRTGQLQSFRRGALRIAESAEVPVIPLWLDGMWGSPLSFSGGKFFYKWPRMPRCNLRLYIGKPFPSDCTVHQVRTAVQILGAKAAVEHRDDFPILPSRAIRVWRRRGRQMLAADTTGVSAGGRELLTRTLALRRLLRREVLGDDEKYIGVLLPPSVGGVAVNVALAMDNRISANLNYSVSSEVINHCIEEVKIKHILSSEKFMERFDFKLDAEVVLLDSLREKITALDKLIAFFQANLLPAFVLDRVLGLHKIDCDDVLTVIFTSGSTGMPKGVLLSHANVSHNVDAIDRAVRLTTDDVVLGILPFFHSFGYTVSLWCGLTLGPRCVYHFNPLESRVVGKLAGKFGATVLLGTPTFLRGYLRRVTKEQFATLDLAIVGAEKTPADLFDAFENQFGVRPTEGYGTTELSPLVSVNIPPSRSSALYQIDRLEGSVGRPLPGVAARIVDPETGADLEANHDGMLLIYGPNVMLGYANQPELTRKAVRDGWYETGDIAHLDDDGFIHITGRLSRFSKIGGEMVPHVRIEHELAMMFSEGDEDEQVRVCVTAVPDEKKGERLVVLHLPTEKCIAEMRKGLTKVGLPNIFVPAQDSFFEVAEIPMLGTGKLDLKGAREKAAQCVGGQA
jgi:acyl-[acyl-carrier-protein]-phospholipid O-acyltransferase/long-chain-fatty-acid--[acyl-carrier-protein] ligase